MSTLTLAEVLTRARLPFFLFVATAACGPVPEGPGAPVGESEPSGSRADSGSRAQEEPDEDPPVARDAGKKPALRDAGSTSDAGSDSPSKDAGARPEEDASADAGQLTSGDAGSSMDPKSFASMLDALFIDAPCAPSTPTPIAKMATCQHPGTTQHVDRKVTFGGEPGATYDVKLRIRGIWEPTFIKGGMRPLGKLPFTVGGTVATGSGDPINYQQYFITVSEPKQTYWLNDYQYVAHDIHKEDYEATVTIAAKATVTVSMSDGNDHEIANWTRDYFEGLPPYDKAPSTGQLLRLDVVSVTKK